MMAYLQGQPLMVELIGEVEFSGSEMVAGKL